MPETQFHWIALLGTMKTYRLIMLGTTLLLQQQAFADASYQETVHITGGSMLGLMKVASMFSRGKQGIDAPQTSIVMVHGNRMARVNQNLVQVVDLDKQTFTNIDNERHQYSVTTFAAFERMENNTAERMQKSSQPDTQMSYKVGVKNTGATKQVDGVDAAEAVLTVEMDMSSASTTQPAAGAMTMISDMWLASQAPGYEEVKQFNLRLGKELAVNLDTSLANGLLATRRGSSQAMAQMRNETVKLKGVPVLQMIRLGATGGASASQQSADSSSSAPAEQGAGRPLAVQQAVQDAKNTPSLGSLMGGGGLGGFIRSQVLNRTQAAVKPAIESQSQSGASGADGSLLDMSIERSHFSTEGAVLSVFDVPAGYMQIKSAADRLNH